MARLAGTTSALSHDPRTTQLAYPRSLGVRRTGRKQINEDRALGSAGCTTRLPQSDRHLVHYFRVRRPGSYRLARKRPRWPARSLRRAPATAFRYSHSISEPFRRNWSMPTSDRCILNKIAHALTRRGLPHMDFVAIGSDRVPVHGYGEAVHVGEKHQKPCTCTRTCTCVRHTKGSKGR